MPRSGSVMTWADYGMITAPPKLLGDVLVFKLHQADLLNAERTFSRACGSVIRPPGDQIRPTAPRRERHPHDCRPCTQSIGPCRRRYTFQDDSHRRLAHCAGWTGFHYSRVARGAESTLLALNRSTRRRRSTKGTRRSKSDPVILSRWRRYVRAISPVTCDLSRLEHSRLQSGTQALRNRSQKSGPLDAGPP